VSAAAHDVPAGEVSPEGTLSIRGADQHLADLRPGTGDVDHAGGDADVLRHSAS
jgi:hypothetical protein